MQNSFQSIKQQFFIYRNGLIADQLRAAGINCYKIIFGLNVPQIAQIARQFTPSMALADALWQDCGIRESRLLATYLFPHSEISLDKAKALVENLQTTEEADMLCFRLLKHLSFAKEIIDLYSASDNKLHVYCTKSLLKHIS